MDGASEETEQLPNQEMQFLRGNDHEPFFDYVCCFFNSCLKFTRRGLQLGVAILANASNVDHWQIPKSIADNFLSEKEPSKETESDPTSDDSKQWVGSFVTNQGEIVVIDERFGKLCFSISPDFKIQDLNRTGNRTFTIGRNEQTLKLVNTPNDKPDSISMVLVGGNATSAVEGEK